MRLPVPLRYALCSTIINRYGIVQFRRPWSTAIRHLTMPYEMAKQLDPYSRFFANCDNNDMESTRMPILEISTA